MIDLGAGHENTENEWYGAISDGHVDFVRTMIVYAPQFEFEWRTYDTLIESVWNDQIEIVQILLDNLRETGFYFDRNSLNRALEQAVDGDHPEIAELLTEHIATLTT